MKKARVVKAIKGLAIALVIMMSVFAVPKIYVETGCPIAPEITWPNPDNDTLEVREFKESLGDYYRDEQGTYFTFPEWWIVYNSDEYAQTLRNERPSDFPYLGSIAQYWQTYKSLNCMTREAYEVDSGMHLMLMVLGFSYSPELGLKGLHEHTIGLIGEMSTPFTKVPEEVFAYEAQERYVDFIHTYPFYEFGYDEEFMTLMTMNPIGPFQFRKTERRAILAVEYLFKAGYAALIKIGTASAYGEVPREIYMHVKNAPYDSTLRFIPDLEITKQLGENEYVIKLPRYHAFTLAATELAVRQVEFVDIAGNDEIFFTVVIPKDLELDESIIDVVYEMDILTDSSRKRIGVKAFVSDLHEIVPLFGSLHDNSIEHFYEY